MMGRYTQWVEQAAGGTVGGGMMNVPVGDGVAVGVRVAVWVAVAVGVAESVPVGVAVQGGLSAEGVQLRVGVAVGVRVGVLVRVGEAVADGVLVGTKGGVVAVGVAVGKVVRNSYAPMSHVAAPLPSPSKGRASPRWSTLPTTAAAQIALSAASTAGLPVASLSA